MRKINFQKIFSLSEIFFLLSALVSFGGCAPKWNNQLNSTIVNTYNDKQFLTNDVLKCPASLEGRTVRLQTNFDKCIQPMKMEVVTITGMDTVMQPDDVSYDGSWQDDISNMIKRNLTIACGTKFSDKSDLPLIYLDFKKLTSQITSIDQKHDTKDFNLATLNSQLDYNISENYVMELEISGTLFKNSRKYAKGLQRKNTGHQLETGSNYLVTVSTRTESSRLVEISILPQNLLLYIQKTAFVMDMQTVILPIIKKEKIISYTLYSPLGDVRSKKSLSTENGGLDEGMDSVTTVLDPSDRTLIDTFAGTGSGVGWFGNSMVGPYAWLIYDLSREIIDNAQ